MLLPRYLVAIAANHLITSVVHAECYDFIVVGSGAGGIPVAERLSESGKQVLLIERGPPSSGRWGDSLGSKNADWLARTNLTFYDVPALDEEIYIGNFSTGIYCPDVVGGIAGCVLGGGTAINSGLWWRPADIDWDYNFPPGWHSGDMANATERAFSKIPGTQVPSSDGKLYLQGGAQVIEGGLRSAGWTDVVANSYPNAKNMTFTNSTFMFSHGERGGPMATYLVEASKRPNFTLWMNTMVSRVVRSGSTATGVEVVSQGSGGHSGLVELAANGSIILSAGAFGTPKILFRSGIGPKDMLKIVNSSSDGASMINKRDWINLPVGKNLIDNINTDVVIRHPAVETYNFTGAYTDPPTSDMDLYLKKRVGILTQSAPNINPVAFEGFNYSNGSARHFEWTARVATPDGSPAKHQMTFSQYLTLGQVARGRTTINGSLFMQVASRPTIKQNSLDKSAIIASVGRMVEALGSVTNLTLIKPSSGADIEKYVSNTQHVEVNHWLGTCKLGLDDGRKGGTSVVDLDTRVYGMENLFVVDASIFPGLTTANPSGAIVIAAERAADRILMLQQES